ncbi:MAG: antibiotic biosynthesis monooxygenase [Pseudomonadota bacterium]
MFVAMNRFKIRPGKEGDFEAIWRGRESHLDDVPGFQAFQLLKGPANDEYALYASHTLWRSRGDFEAWTKSDAFRKAHAGAGGHGDVYLGHPQFEGFDTVDGTMMALGDPYAAP